MKSIRLIPILIIVIILFARCNVGSKMQEHANQQFGDQHFKTAIALIELHKTRYGEYPATLDSLKYVGDWDKMIWSSVKYEKLKNGYALDLINGWVGKPKHLKYPKEFWEGLGVVRSNMK
ncbi:MAG TPA: hypothetical protein VK151_01445 [Fluviicola sp.]|nr:hypothetical protein [Fluviicola sp.]